MKLYWINAGEAAELYSKRLVGLRVNTEKMGSYPGGMAIVTKVAPDKTAPEIVMEVAHLTWENGDGSNLMGIFEGEAIGIEPETAIKLNEPHAHP